MFYIVDVALQKDSKKKTNIDQIKITDSCCVEQQGYTQTASSALTMQFLHNSHRSARRG